MQGKLRLYGCGGTGVNLTSFFEQDAAGTQPGGHSIVYPTYIDTSRSNLRSDLNPDHIFILEDVDGSGKVRRENHEQISRNVKSLLQKYEPADLNVVVYSASGGSGSVFGPLIHRELLERGASVVSIVIGSDESTISAQNTLNTLKSLEAIAERLDTPVVISYEHNEKDVKRSAVDTACRHTIASLSILASRQNSEMDTKDIANWLRFNKTTSVGARLAFFDVYCSNTAVEELDSQPVSIASLYASPDDTPLAIAPEYHAAGYPRHKIDKFEVLHFVVVLNGVPVVVKKLNASLSELEQRRRSRIEHDRIVDSRDVLTKDDMVL